MGFINTHQPCDECGSSDGLSVNEDGSTKCFVCGSFVPTNNTTQQPTMETTTQAAPRFIQGDFMAIPSRGIHKDVCKRYDYRIGEHNGDACHIATYRDEQRNIVSQKIRFEGKDFKSIGSPTYFWGQHLWPNGGKRLTITEGEFDCLTVAQVVGEGKWPVVSLPSGAQGAKRVFQKQMKWLEKFDDKKIGYIALEESIERTANSIIGLDMNKLLHLEPITVNDQYRKSFEKTVGSGRVFFYDHWGSLESDNLLNHIRYMSKALGVEYIVLDHLSIVVSGLDSGDERRIIDNTMTKLRALVEECKIGLILVSHLKRPEGRGHENGAETTLAQLRGSASIAQLSDMVLGLERDQQNADTRNRTNVRVLKNRFSGDTGLASTLLFSHITGRLTETDAMEADDSDDDNNGPF
jgi:hypothetical protein